jgi:hypothetical protein
LKESTKEVYRPEADGEFLFDFILFIVFRLIDEEPKEDKQFNFQKYIAKRRL